MEVDLARHGRNANAVAVVRDAGDDVLEQIAVAGIVEGAEAEGVEVGDGARAHREDVAQDAADAGRRALKRLDGAGVVVRFDLEDDAEVVVERNHARVLQRALLLRLFVVLEQGAARAGNTCSRSAPTTSRRTCPVR